MEVSLTRGKFFNATLPSLTLISRPTSTLHFFAIGGGGGPPPIAMEARPISE